MNVLNAVRDTHVLVEPLVSRTRSWMAAPQITNKSLVVEGGSGLEDLGITENLVEEAEQFCE